MLTNVEKFDVLQALSRAIRVADDHRDILMSDHQRIDASADIERARRHAEELIQIMGGYVIWAD